MDTHFYRGDGGKRAKPEKGRRCGRVGQSQAERAERAEVWINEFRCRNKKYLRSDSM
jgi:hypothetical protein